MRNTTTKYELDQIKTCDSTDLNYGNEILSAGWNPAVALMHSTPTADTNALPSDLATADAELFLQRMYRAQS